MKRGDLMSFFFFFSFSFLTSPHLTFLSLSLPLSFPYPTTPTTPHRWWWRAFLNGGGVAAYIFLYSGFYFFTRLEITTFVPTLLYFGYMSCVSLSVFCLTGSVGLWACLKFVRSIYAAVKID